MQGIRQRERNKQGITMEDSRWLDYWRWRLTESWQRGWYQCRFRWLCQNNQLLARVDQRFGIRCSPRGGRGRHWRQ